MGTTGPNVRMLACFRWVCCVRVPGGHTLKTKCQDRFMAGGDHYLNAPWATSGFFIITKGDHFIVVDNLCAPSGGFKKSPLSDFCKGGDHYLYDNASNTYYSETCANDHLYSATTSLQRPAVQDPNNSHTSSMRLHLH